ncbi:restriction endonuclease PLD domain-containing protein (plasmid) [Cyanobacterium sp. IPPAS B-1200]|uniref:restriction endonuclease PLD domain-containing protein n=1 Tax=Cyanobacterium sp. IPPAS B-1200 TaxID=1562720 RepID=UPI0008524F70|nr:restriction endonuclease PLD domain-containing protein [Cyanobacterium sp. IPPAS B-1200]OEJ77597.1 hypothetical protein A5482_15310 [Cyanobacterium sp. IPPAS B-1200]
MHTNLDNYGGNFRDILDKEFQTAKNVTVASGYASLDIINTYKDRFWSIAKSGGVSKLLLGMAFHEGLSQKKLDTLNDLNQKLLRFGNESGVYVTNGRRYHGKVYKFTDDDTTRIYVGSSNFSSSGVKGNIECTIPVIPENQKNTLIKFLDNLYSQDHSVTIDNVIITVPGKKKIILSNVESKWKSLERYDPASIDLDGLPRFELPLSRIADEEKSNLNVYFGKGRLDRRTGKITPRPWYEIELISSSKLINSQKYYPKGDFLAYTDNGYIIPMKTQGAYFKNLRSRNSLQIFGIWLKGKLENSEVLKKYEPVTLDTLEEYGNDKLTLYKIEEDKYYMEF